MNLKDKALNLAKKCTPDFNLDFLTNIKDFSQDNINKALGAVKNIGDAKKAIITLLVSIDYDKLLKSLHENKKSKIFLQIDVLIPTLEALRDVSCLIKESEDNDLKWSMIQGVVRGICLKQALDQLEPFINLIPFGSLVMLLLRLLITYVNTTDDKKTTAVLPEKNDTGGISGVAEGYVPNC
jgi:hypothetical protein